MIVLILTVTTLASSAFASAAALGGISGDVVAGDAAITPCDADGFSESYTTSGGNVIAITLAGIADPACEGGKLSVTLADATGASIASGGPQTIEADADTAENSITVSVSPSPASEQVSAYHVSIVGP